jgi:hypothetical protein
VDLDVEITRWWPLGKQRSVVLDPQRSFGAPIASGSGIPTATLVLAAERHGYVVKAKLDKFDTTASVGARHQGSSRSAGAKRFNAGAAGSARMRPASVAAVRTSSKTNSGY